MAQWRPGVPKGAKKKLKSANKKLGKARKFLKQDNVKKALAEMSKAVSDLQKSVDKGATEGGTLFPKLVEAARKEAQDAIDAAIAMGGNQTLIDEAISNMVKAQDRIAYAEYDKAISYFKTAWIKAQEAVSGPNTPITSKWVGYYSTELLPKTPLYMELIQSGDSIKGIYADKSGDFGSLTAT